MVLQLILLLLISILLSISNGFSLKNKINQPIKRFQMKATYSIIDNVSDDFEKLLVTRCLNIEKDKIKVQNRLLYSWLIHIEKTSTLLNNVNWSTLITRLQNAAPYTVSATLVAESSANTSAVLRFTVKPYILILPLLQTKSNLLQYMSQTVEIFTNQNVGLLFNVTLSNENQLILNDWYDLTAIDSIDKESAIFITNSVSTSVDQVFRSINETIEDKYISDIFRKYKRWVQENNRNYGSNGGENEQIIDPFQLFLNFVMKEGIIGEEPNINEKSSSLDIFNQRKLLSSYLMTCASILSQIKRMVQEYQQQQLIDLPYYQDKVLALDMLGPPMQLLSSDSVTNDQMSSLASMKMIKNIPLSNPQLQVSVQGLLLTEEEKNTFLQYYVLRLMTSNDTNIQDGNSTTSATAGNPNKPSTGQLSDGVSLSSGRKWFRADSTPETQTSPDAYRRPPSVSVCVKVMSLMILTVIINLSIIWNLVVRSP
jgi:hypothetical protein